MIVRYARARYIDNGGDPAVIDDMSWGDILDWLHVHDVFDARVSLGGIPEE